MTTAEVDEVTRLRTQLAELRKKAVDESDELRIQLAEMREVAEALLPVAEEVLGERDMTIVWAKGKMSELAGDRYPSKTFTPPPSSDPPDYWGSEPSMRQVEDDPWIVEDGRGGHTCHATKDEARSALEALRGPG